MSINLTRNSQLIQGTIACLRRKKVVEEHFTTIRYEPTTRR